MKLIGLIAMGLLVLLAFWMMYGERKSKRREPGADTHWLPGSGPGDSSHHHHHPHDAHHSDAGHSHGGFDGGGGHH